MCVINKNEKKGRNFYGFLFLVIYLGDGKVFGFFFTSVVALFPNREIKYGRFI